MTGDNDMRLSYKGWLIFSQPLCLLVALSGYVVAGSEQLQGVTVSLVIDTLIANILVIYRSSVGKQPL